MKERLSDNVLPALNELARGLLGKTTLPEIAWEITEKVMDRIGMDDCVIYILDRDTDILHQIAAYGEKNPGKRAIKNSIEIPLGEGVVGTVASTGRPLLIDDTSTFAGYIPDEYPGLSELSVPIIDNGIVLGVIDSEHSEKAFFGKDHLDLFTTIASISAAQIRVALETERRIKAENDLRESEERWQRLIENQPEALQITKEGKISYLNPAGIRLYEAESVKKIIDLDMYQFVSDDIKKELKIQHELLLRYGVADPVEYPITTLRGNKKLIEANSTTIIIEGETVIQTILRDITEKKKAETDLRNTTILLRTLIDSINSGLLMESPDRTIMHTNQMFCDLFGNAFTQEDILGQDCASLIQPASHAFSDPETFRRKTNEVFEKSEPSLNEIWYTADDRVFERDFIPIWLDGQYIGSAWQYRDVTNKKRAEEKLRKALETERDYNELNKNLISMVSHEFKTPLTSINSTAELLLEYSDRFNRDEMKQRVQRIYNSSMKMDGLIQDVLTIGKLESGNTLAEPVEFNFPDFLDELISSLSLDVLKDRTINLEKRGELNTVYLDRDLMELIIRNLLENAGKYSFEPDPIDIRYEINENQLKLSCIDRGIGIPPKDQPMIFESFVRGTNSSEIKGTGLGLPIVKKSLEKLDGSFNLHSVENRGTTISISIPIISDS